jgi:hypothetical protein
MLSLRSSSSDNIYVRSNLLTSLCELPTAYWTLTKEVSDEFVPIRKLASDTNYALILEMEKSKKFNDEELCHVAREFQCIKNLACDSLLLGSRQETKENKRSETIQELINHIDINWDGDINKLLYNSAMKFVEIIERHAHDARNLELILLKFTEIYILTYYIIIK